MSVGVYAWYTSTSYTYIRMRIHIYIYTFAYTCIHHTAETVEHLDECGNPSLLLCQTLALSSSVALYMCMAYTYTYVYNTLYHIPTMHGLTLSRLSIHMKQTITPYCLLNPIHTTTVLCLLIHITYQLSKMVHACYAFT